MTCTTASVNAWHRHSTVAFALVQGRVYWAVRPRINAVKQTHSMHMQPLVSNTEVKVNHQLQPV